MKKLIVAFTILLFGYKLSAQNTNALLSDYINVKNALVNGSSIEASEALGVLIKAVKESGYFKDKDILLKASENMSKENGIEKQRSAFNNLSVIMWKVVKATNKTNESVYYQYCPMKKAYWLSKEKKIENPYYGSSMLTCGKVIEQK